MQYTFKYESNALAELQGLEHCIELEVELELSVTPDLEIEVHSILVYDSGTELSQKNRECIDQELEKEVDHILDSQSSEILQDWQGHLIDRASLQWEEYDG